MDLGRQFHSSLKYAEKCKPINVESSADTVQTCRLSFKLKEETPNICYLRRSFEDVLLGQITTLISCTHLPIQPNSHSNIACKDLCSVWLIQTTARR